MAVREDGRALDAVAGEARLELQSGRPWLGDLAPPLRDALLSAGPGELVGPLGGDDGWTVVQVLAKTMPSADDPETRQRAEAALLQERVDREVQARVRWLAPR
jgi:parvulin-like peptidyl-prolyl isomerase